MASSIREVPSDPAPPSYSPKSVTFRAGAGFTPSIYSYDSGYLGSILYLLFKVDGEAGITLQRSGIGITGTIQVTMPPMMTIEAGARFSWDGWLTRGFGLTPMLFVGGAYYPGSEGDDAPAKARGISIHAGLLARFRFQQSRVGVAVQLFNLRVQRRYPFDSPYRPHSSGTTALLVDLAGVHLTF